MSALVELWADNPAGAEHELRWAVATLQGTGELAWLPTIAGILAEAIYVQGRYDEAEAFVRLGEDTAGSDDAYSQGLLRCVRAKILASAGQPDAAVALARQAVAIAEPTDFLFFQSFVLDGLGEVLQLAGLRDDADRALAEAVRVCEQKGFVVGAQKARARRERVYSPTRE
jgi:tetratricopeptide (TPR) repeat protein